MRCVIDSAMVVEQDVSRYATIKANWALVGVSHPFTIDPSTAVVEQIPETATHEVAARKL